MNTEAILQCIEEAQAALAALNEPLAGWSDFAALELSAASADVVLGQLAVLNHLVELERVVIEQAVILEDAIQELLAAGHPAIPTIEVSPEVGAELDAQLRTQQAARATATVLYPTTQVRSVVSAERPTPKDEG